MSDDGKYKCQISVYRKTKLVRSYIAVMDKDRTNIKFKYREEWKTYENSALDTFGSQRAKSAPTMAVEFIIRKLKKYDPRFYRVQVEDRKKGEADG